MPHVVLEHERLRRPQRLRCRREVHRTGGDLERLVGVLDGGRRIERMGAPRHRALGRVRASKEASMKRAALMVLVVASCSSQRDATVSGSSVAQAQMRLEGLRSRFPSAELVATGEDSPSLARVTLPARGDGDVEVDDVRSSVAVRFHLEGAASATRADVEGLSVYADAGIVQRVSADRVEDFVAFDVAPQGEEARYVVDVSRVAGLRLVGASLEFLDDGGAPRLRVAPPYVVDAAGTRYDATLTVEGCAYDTSTAPPWNRAVTAPNATSCTLHIGWHGVSYPALLDPGWMATGTMDYARDQHTQVVLADGRVLEAYGNACGGGCFYASQSEVYDPTTGTFGNGGSLPDRGADRPGVLLGDGQVLLVGNGGELYDPATSTMTPTSAMVGSSAGGPMVVLPSGQVLVVGATPQTFDPTSGTFTATTGPMVETRTNPAAVLLSTGKVLVSGGGDATAELYDPASGTFTATGSMTVARSNHAMIALGTGKILVVGGAGAAAELYDPTTGMFTATGSLSLARTSFQTGLLPSGDVLVIGGFSGTAPTTSVEAYDPATGVFAPAPSMTVPRGYHAASVLPTGEVLATGGRTTMTNFGSSLATAEILPVVAPGAMCAGNDDCASGQCDQSVCCAATCTSTCHQCATGTGSCAVVSGADDPDSCTGADTCDSTGACKLKIGQACTAASACASGFCADGFCCNQACSGSCEACDGETKGSCLPVAGTPHGTRACAGEATLCGGACDGTNATTCIFPSTTTGCGTMCTAGMETVSACDGVGGCKATGPVRCPGNYVCADATSCKESCTTGADCATGYACVSGKCAATGTCDGAHTITSTGGATTDCTPFDCDTTRNSCKVTCTSPLDCAAPNVCDATGTCTAPPTNDSTSPGSSGGCSAAPGGESSSGNGASWYLFAAVAACGMRRRRGARAVTRGAAIERRAIPR
jgi:hypothetical protein